MSTDNDLLVRVRQHLQRRRHELRLRRIKFAIGLFLGALTGIALGMMLRNDYEPIEVWRGLRVLLGDYSWCKCEDGCIPPGRECDLILIPEETYILPPLITEER